MDRSKALRLCIFAVFFLGGCHQGREKDEVDAPIVDDRQVLKSEEEIIRELVDGWLGQQKMARMGKEYWDEYVETSVLDDDLSEFGKAMHGLREVSAEFEKYKTGRAGDVPSTVVVPVKLNAVRSWDILRVDIKEHDAKERAVTQREKKAEVIVRVDSSNMQGIQITQSWQVMLFRNSGDWGIYAVGEWN